jgi:hypothetical protein
MTKPPRHPYGTAGLLALVLCTEFWQRFARKRVLLPI